MPERNLLILHTVGLQALSDWEAVKSRIEAAEPAINVRIVSRGGTPPILPDKTLARWVAERPSLIFSERIAREFVLPRGKRYTGQNISKLDQSNRMRAAGLNAPRSVLLVPGLLLNREIWGDYVIVKPMKGTRGSGVRLVKTEDVGKRYRDLTLFQGVHHDMVVQQFIPHTDPDGFPEDWRALAIFGKPLYIHYRKWATRQKSPEVLATSFSGEIASNVRGVERSRELVTDERIIELCRKAADVFPEVPVLALDIVRDPNTGLFSILEVNPSGGSWHLSSDYALHTFDKKMRRGMYRQFNALETAAQALTDRTLREAV